MTDQTVPTPRAWHSNPDLKAEVMERLRAHQAADTIVKGVYQMLDPDAATGYRGCALGCTLPKLSDAEIFTLNMNTNLGDSAWWQRVEDEYGIDNFVALLIDGTFEDHDTEDAPRFAVDVVEAIPVGADLSNIKAAWLDAQMDDAEPGAAARWLIDTLTNAPVPAGV